MYECVVTFLDAIISLIEYQHLHLDDERWNWDKETKVKALGMKSSLSCFQSIAVFKVTKKFVLK